LFIGHPLPLILEKNTVPVRLKLKQISIFSKPIIIFFLGSELRGERKLKKGEYTALKGLTRSTPIASAFYIRALSSPVLGPPFSLEWVKGFE
jgi:hypothetical protein